MNRSDDGGLTYGPAVIAAVGGNTTGNIAVDQRDGTVYFCHQGASPNGNQVQVAIGHSPTLTVAPVVYTNVVAATGVHNIANLFPVCKVSTDGTVYVAYSDGGEGIYIAHSLDQGKSWQRAMLREPNIAKAWVRWDADWDARPGKQLIRLRATDERGNTQPEKVAFNEQGYLYNALVDHPTTVK